MHASELLLAAQEIIRAHKDSGKHTDRIQSGLSSVSADLDKVVEQVKGLEEFVVLDTGALDGKRTDDAMRMWSGLAPGLYTDEKRLRPIIKTSPLLDSLYRNALDVKSIRKFSAAEYRLAKALGDSFLQFGNVLARVRRTTKVSKIPAGSSIENEKSVLLTCAAESVEFLELLGTHNVVKIRRLFVNVAGWKPIQLEWFSRHASDTQVLVVLAINNAPLFQLLWGGWLEAYVHSIVLDQLPRFRAPFEVYTGVRYQTPSDVAQLEGEFDILGQVENRLICVECKSGMLSTDRGVISRLVDKTSRLKAAVKSVSPTGLANAHFDFYLVFDPTQSDSEHISNLLHGSGIKALRPNEVRSEMVSTFTR